MPCQLKEVGSIPLVYHWHCGRNPPSTNFHFWTAPNLYVFFPAVIEFEVISYQYFPGLSSHRYSVIFSADSEIFVFSAMFRAEPADFNFDISGHNWFRDEHFWTSLIQSWTLLASSKQRRTMKKAKKVVFFQYWCWRDEKSKILE